VEGARALRRRPACCAVAPYRAPTPASDLGCALVCVAGGMGVCTAQHPNLSPPNPKEKDARLLFVIHHYAGKVCVCLAIPRASSAHTRDTGSHTCTSLHCPNLRTLRLVAARLLA
jgi:hypothetical protein